MFQIFTRPTALVCAGVVAALQWVAAETGTYRRVTSFESVNTGQLQVTRY
jgi:hypothetical protein